MNKKTISIITLTILYSILFYEQHVGLNFLLFTIATLGFFFFQFKESLKNKAALLLSFAAIFSASFAVIYGSYLSMWSTIISLMILPGVFINKRSNILVDFITSIVNIAASSTFMIIEMIESSKQEKGKGKSFLRVLKYLVPLVFIIAFFFIYRAMNPLFENFTQEIADLISLGWVFYTLGGLTLVYSIYRQKRSDKVDNWEKNWLFNIDSSTIIPPKWNEAISFIILFIVLNLMLLSVNVMDLNYLYIGEKLPDGIAHKQFVHKGVGMLILSIVLGISILLYFFRGALNFDKNKKLVKVLAFIWLGQNLFMIYSTALRNTMYIDEALLSYKRIGVYFWLLFAVIGLITLLIKLYNNKTVWFLAKHNSIALFIVLVASSSVDWDMVISNFNVKRALERDEISTFDKKYMLSLSEGNITGLFSIKDIAGFEKNPDYSYNSFSRSYLSNRWHLDSKIYRFLNGELEGDWRSYSIRRAKVRRDIENLDNQNLIDTLNYQDYGYINLKAFHTLKSLKKIDLTNCSIENWEELKNHPFLETIIVTDGYIEGLEHFKDLKALKTLHINGASMNTIKQYRDELPGVKVY